MKKILSLILALVMILSVTVSADSSIEFKIGETTFKTLGEAVTDRTTDVAPYMEGDVVMLPLRVVADVLEYSVEWDSAAASVKVTKDNTELVIKIGTDTATLNGESVTLDTPAVIKGDRTMIPASLLEVAFDCKMDIAAFLGTVLIYTSPAVMSINSLDVQYDEFKCYFDILKAQIADRQTIVDYLVAMFSEFYTYYDVAEQTGFSAIVPSESIKAKVDAAVAEASDAITVLPGTLALLTLKNEVVNFYLDLVSQFTAPDEAEIKNAYNENYVAAKHILISTFNTETGEPLSPTAKAAAKKKAEKILFQIQHGTDFDYLMRLHTADIAGLEAYPNGYTFTKGEMVESFENAVFALQENYLSGVVESPYGYHIIKRIPLPELTDEVADSVYNSLQQTRFENYIATIKGGTEIKINKDVLDTIQ